jgi:mannose-6-phosphate isomerase-like protein (cupin superfamily)
MSDYTHLNLKENVENVAERFGLAPNMEARYGRGPLGVEGGGFSYQKLAPNYRSPTAHRHHGHEEVYIAIAGSGRVKIEDEIRDVRQWDALRFAPATARGFEAGPDGLELLALGFGDADDVEMLGDFWPT